MSNAEILSAAYHEAGHFVFAQNQCQTPDSLEMFYHQSHGRWEGRTELPKIEHLLMEIQYVIRFGYCISGCFAQIKHAVHLSVPDATIPWEPIVDWMMYPERGSLELAFTEGKKFIVPAWWFDEQDADMFNRYSLQAKFGLPDARSFGNYLCQAFDQAVLAIEEPRSWAKIENLAVKLASSISQQQARLDANTVVI